MSLRGKTFVFVGLLVAAAFVSIGLDSVSPQVGIEVAMQQMDDSVVGAVNNRAWSRLQYTELGMLAGLAGLFWCLFGKEIRKVIHGPKTKDKNCEEDCVDDCCCGVDAC